MNQQRLDEIRARCEAATPGPWVFGGFWADQVGSTAGEETEIVCGEVTRADGPFIAHARTDAPDMLDEIGRLTAELAAMTARAEAAERDIVWMLTADPAELCIVCKHLTSDICMVGNCHNADWRGPCAENGGAG